MTGYTWGAYGLQPREENVLKSLMSLIGRRKNADWMYALRGNPDVLFCRSGSPRADESIKHQLDSGHPVCVLVSTERSKFSLSPLEISLPISSQAFEDLLDYITEQLSKQSLSRTTPPREDFPSEATDSIVQGHKVAISHRPDREWLELTKKIHQSRSGRWLQLGEGDSAGYIDWSTRLCYVSFDCTIPWSELPVSWLSHSPLSVSELPNNLQSHALDPLLWFLGTKSGEGKLLPWIASNSCFGLSQWPDFGRLPSLNKYIALAASMVRKSESIESLSAQSNMTVSEITDAINGFEMLGLLNVVESRVSTRHSASRRSPLSTVSREAPPPSFFTRVRNVLGMSSRNG